MTWLLLSKAHVKMEHLKFGVNLPTPSSLHSSAHCKLSSGQVPFDEGEYLTVLGPHLRWGLHGPGFPALAVAESSDMG